MKNFSLFFLVVLASCSHISGSGPLKESTREIANFQTCFKEMSTFFRTDKKLKTTHKPFHMAESLDELEALYGNESFIDIQRRLSKEDIIANNKRVFELLSRPLPGPLQAGKTSYINLKEAKEIHKSMREAAVNENLDCYDPKGETGFCFGKATISNIEALIRGVDPRSSRKIWIVGDMGQWGHHVANIEKAKTGWFAIDIDTPIIKTRTWYNFWDEIKKNGAKDLMLFISRAERFGPYDATEYSPVTLFNTTEDNFKKADDFYRGYFHDYFKDLEERMKNVKKFPIR